MHIVDNAIAFAVSFSVHLPIFPTASAAIMGSPAHSKAFSASNAFSNGEAEQSVLQHVLLAARQHYFFGSERLSAE